MAGKLYNGNLNANISLLSTSAESLGPVRFTVPYGLAHFPG